MNILIYWENELKQIVAPFNVLSSSGLPLRGHDEKHWLFQDGYYIIAKEFLSAFDPFIAK